MKTAYIFHDSFCDPFSEWYPWMKTSLEKIGYVVTVPQFPSPAGQSYESWKLVLKNYLSTLNSETIIIGHGTGAGFAVKLISELPSSIRGLFIVAGYSGPTGNIGIDRISKTFYEPEPNWELLKKNCGVIRVFAGEKDPFVPLETTQDLANHLGEQVEIIPDGGHLGKAAGFSQLIPVLGRITESLNELDRSIAIEQEEPKEELLVQQLANKIRKSEESSVNNEKPVEQKIPEHHPELAAHTMYQDLSKIVQQNKGSVASSLLTKARTEKALAESKSPFSGKNILYIISSIISLGIVFAIVIYLLQQYTPVALKPLPREAPSLIQADEHRKISVGSEPSFILDQKIRNSYLEPLAQGTLRDIYYIGPEGFLSLREVFKTLSIEVSEVLVDAFIEAIPRQVPVFMHGIYRNNDATSHFMVVKVKNYDSMFSLMREWEPTMLRDLSSFMNVSPDFLKRRLEKDVYTDELVNNKNLRVLRYKSGKKIDTENFFGTTNAPYQEDEIMIGYFFLNEKTLIIVDNLDIIPELLKRYANSQIF